MFILLILMIDIFMNLWRYLNYEVPVLEILRVSFYYLPKSFSYALPVSLLFASAYTLGDLYSKNELISIFTSGISFIRFSFSLIIIGIIASIFSFFFEDRVVIHTFKMKNELSRILLHQQRTVNNSDIVIRAGGGSIIYSVDFYDTNSEILNGIIIIEKEDDNRLKSVIRATRAVWDESGEFWDLINPVIYEWHDGFFRIRNMGRTEIFREPPDTFRRNMVNAEDLNLSDIQGLVLDLEEAGLPTTAAMAEYYRRFSFPGTCLIVLILSIAMGGRFRKNILLMSLLASLSAAVVYFVIEMISMMVARQGLMPPLLGAWLPVFVFIFLGILLMRTAKT